MLPVPGEQNLQRRDHPKGVGIGKRDHFIARDEESKWLWREYPYLSLCSQIAWWHLPLVKARQKPGTEGAQEMLPTRGQPPGHKAGQWRKTLDWAGDSGKERMTRHRAEYFAYLYISLWGRYRFPHFTDEKTEVRNFNQDCLYSRFCALNHLCCVRHYMKTKGFAI